MTVYRTLIAVSLIFELTAVICSAEGGSGSAQTSAADIRGTAWQLVKIKGSDDTTKTPDKRSKYTLTFGTGGRVTARVDCNRGTGSWKSAGPNQLQFGPMAMSRALCPAPSLHDRFVKDIPYVRTYMLKDGHLFYH